MSDFASEMVPSGPSMIDDLILAARRGEIEGVMGLLRRGADINGKDQIGHTALTEAVRGRHMELIRSLLDRGADPNTPDFRGCTPTTQAVDEAQPWAVLVPDPRPLELLRLAGGRVGLREAVLMGDVELARRICEDDPATDVSGDAHYIYHDTFLMIAARYASPDMVRLLLDQGADIEGTDDIGMTALMKAARAGRLDVVALLLDRGAEINQGDWLTNTPLSEARDGGHAAVVELLMSRGAKSGAG